MEKLAKVILEVTTWSWIVFVIIAIVMTLSSCGSMKKCCERTVNEVYKYEGMYADQEWDRD
mgnify:FL=1